jgi:hypothetical protein
MTVWKITTEDQTEYAVKLSKVKTEVEFLRLVPFALSSDQEVVSGLHYRHTTRWRGNYGPHHNIGSFVGIPALLLVGYVPS